MGLALEKLKKNELPTNIDGLDLLISDVVKNVADGSLVDYINSIYGEEFIIRANYSC